MEAFEIVWTIDWLIGWTNLIVSHFAKSFAPVGRRHFQTITFHLILLKVSNKKKIFDAVQSSSAQNNQQNCTMKVLWYL
jgi:hypothetical protein